MIGDALEEPDSLQIDAKLADLEKIRQYIISRATLLQVGDSLSYDIQLAVTELVTNSLVHGYPNQQGWIEIEMKRQKENIFVHLRDRGPEFDPTHYPPPDLSIPLGKRSLGGMGIHLTRQVTKQMIYRSLPDGGNETTLIFSA